MNTESDVLEAERAFFTALIQADVEALDQLLTDDFILIDVMRGSEVTKSALIGAIESRQIRFEAITPIDARVRLYPTTAIVTGSTRMSGLAGETPFTASSRYTHVYVEQIGQWRLASAQGTQIA